MTYSNKATVNFAGGEVSTHLQGRNDLPLFNKVLQRMENFIAEPQGPARFRNGTVFVCHTRRNNPAVFIPFQFNDSQSYLIEATNQYFRFYKDGGSILEATKTITAITKANPGVVTSNGHGYVNGNEVYVASITGMTQLNGKRFLIAGVTTNTFTLTDDYGTAIDTTNYSTYISGGTAARIYEIITPYLTADLTGLQYAQNADTMYITHRNYEPRKLIRTTEINWGLSRYARTAEPFITAKSITAATKANPGVITSVAHGFSTGNHVYIDSIVGMIELNNQHYLFVKIDADTFSLTTLAGVAVDTTAYTTYTSGGKLELYGSVAYPRCVCFTSDARLEFAGSSQAPETFWYSKGPSAAGAVRFDDFTTGTNATDAVIFTLAPIHGKVDAIGWLTNNDRFIVAGCFGTVRRIYGATEEDPVTPSAINAKAINSRGADAVLPVADGVSVFYIQRGGQFLESTEYDYTINGYTSTNRNLVAEHITVSGIKQMVSQLGKPDIIWLVRNDGVLLGLTHQDKENVSAWHRHELGGEGLVQWLGILPRPSNVEQLWCIVQRNINNHTVYCIEYMADPPVFPVAEDFFTGEDNKDSDSAMFGNALYEIAKHAIHLDAVSTYDGSSYGTNANATLTVGANANVLSSTGVLFTSSAAVFDVTMIGRELWGEFNGDGTGGGRALITGFNTSSVVEGTIYEAFPSGYVFAVGNWYLTATTVTGLGYLEGQTVGLIADGACPPDEVVTNGSITTDTPASIIHVGLKYTGTLITLPLDQGGVSGPAQSKTKNIVKVAFRFINSSIVKFGADLYHLTELTLQKFLQTGRPIPLGTEVKEMVYEDSWTQDKRVVVVQENALPCTIATVDVYMEVTDEQ